MSYGRAAALVTAFATLAYAVALATWVLGDDGFGTAAILVVIFIPFLVPLVAVFAWAAYRALERSLDLRSASESARRTACMVLGAALGPALVLPFLLGYLRGWNPPNAGYLGASALAAVFGLASGALIHRLANS